MLTGPTALEFQLRQLFRPFANITSWRGILRVDVGIEGKSRAVSDQLIRRIPGEGVFFRSPFHVNSNQLSKGLLYKSNVVSLEPCNLAVPGHRLHWPGIYELSVELCKQGQSFREERKGALFVFSIELCHPAPECNR